MKNIFPSIINFFFRNAKSEKYIFYFVVIINLIPVLASKFFPSMDGAAHLYNSNLINHLISNSNSPLQQYFVFNSEILPNWSGHFLLSLLIFIFNAIIAEKLLLISLLVFLPITFRAIIQRINSKNSLVSYFIFPFTYSLPFWFGFYNFSIGLLLLFVTVYFWLSKENSAYKIKDKFILFVLICSTYFSHLLVFCLLLIILVVRILFVEFEKIRTENTSLKTVTIKILNQTILLLFSAIVPLYFTYNYFLAREQISPQTKLPVQDLINWLYKIQPIIALNESVEQPFTKNIFFVFCTMLLLAAIEKFRFSIHLKNKLVTVKKFIHNSFSSLNFWLLCCIILLILYFYLPDEHANASFISIRIFLLFFLFFILFLASLNHKKIILFMAVFIMLYNHFRLNYYYTKEAVVLGDVATRINKFAPQIEVNSIVLPINFSSHWFMGHYSNYLGVDKPMVILENYEAVQGYFPLDWNRNKMPNLTLASNNSGQVACLNWETNLTNKRKKIDYVFIMGDPPDSIDLCERKIFAVLKKSYKLVKADRDLKLYKSIN
ncbi:MAG: hypothetical protein WCO37_03915 [Bacteroidota bacterium]